MTLSYRCSKCGTELATTNGDVLDVEIKRLRKALITAAQWMPTPGSEYTEEAKADVRQVQEALGWIPIVTRDY